MAIANASTTASSTATLADGSQVAVWSDASGVFARRFSALAGTMGDALQLDTVGKVDGVAALAGGGYAVEYETSDAVYVQVVGADGRPLAARITLVTAAQLAPTSPADPGYQLRGGSGVIAAPDGSFLASYRTYHDVRIPGDTAFTLVAQRFDASGASLAAPQNVSSAYFETNIEPAAALPGGGFVIAHDNRLANTLVSVYDPAFKWLGNYSSPLTGANQIAMDAAGLTGGRVVAIWSQADTNEVRGQIFHLDAAAPGGSTTDTAVFTFAGVLGPAHVLTLPGDRFLLTWGGNSAQVFDASGQPVSAVMRIASENVALTATGQLVAIAQEGTQLVAHYDDI